jgi:hypothetical protein
MSEPARLGLVGAVVLPGLLLLLPAPPGLTVPGQRMAAVFLMALILWATEALPVAVSSLLTIQRLGPWSVAEKKVLQMARDRGAGRDGGMEPGVGRGGDQRLRGRGPTCRSRSLP